jgi:hypothetical protein
MRARADAQAWLAKSGVDRVVGMRPRDESAQNKRVLNHRLALPLAIAIIEACAWRRVDESARHRRPA